MRRGTRKGLCSAAICLGCCCCAGVGLLRRLRLWRSVPSPGRLLLLMRLAVTLPMLWLAAVWNSIASLLLLLLIRSPLRSMRRRVVLLLLLVVSRPRGRVLSVGLQSPGREGERSVQPPGGGGGGGGRERSHRESCTGSRKAWAERQRPYRCNRRRVRRLRRCVRWGRRHLVWD